MKKKLATLIFSVLALCAFGIANPAWPQDAQVNQADAFRKEGRYAEAIAALKSAIAILQAQNKLETPGGAVLLNNLGELYYQLGRYPDAIPYYERSVSLARVGTPEPQNSRSLIATLALSISSRGAPPTP